ncbi:Rpn family recombination-promoting nuclease/putative transposase [Desulfurella sp.]|uniref:Rpn family recombination-promoting nuclease/putative transposase n=1 Tax=Desulfurella sp. TaxID=1962857 RepID=UPI0025C1E7C2|nr:Rpn family recombination-promoting nuclease/putative transposase [Desulfurella sp.]
MDKDNNIKSQQYDVFFKTLLSRKENAKSLIEFTLDKNLLPYIDLNSIVPLDTQRISKKYKQLYMDAAFRVKFKEEDAQIYFIIEHKSESLSFSPLQILSYMYAVWDYNQKNNQPYEPIIPIVFYHGIEPWKKPIFFADYFKHKDLIIDYLPNFKYILTDTSQISDDTILKAIDNIEFKAGVYLLKHVFEKNIENIKTIIEIIKNTKEDTIFVFLDYISHLETYDEEEVEKTFKEILGGDKMAPLVDKWIKQGEEIGREKGLLEGIEKGMEKGLEIGIATEARNSLIDTLEAKFGNLPKDIILVIKNIQDIEKLRGLRKIAIKAQSLDEVKKEL